MKALQITAEHTIEICEVAQPVLKSNQALVKVSAVALNRRDQWIREGMYPNIQFGTTLGSDACGEVVEANDASNKSWIGKKVVINPNVNWGDDPAAQSADYSVLGMPVAGAFAEYIVVDVDRLVEKPKHLSDEQAAALPLGGLTAYRAIMNHGQLKSSDTVLISGFGGGVAQFAFQFAVAKGAKVYVTSGSQEKIDQAIEMGAMGGFNYKEENWAKEAFKIPGVFDIVIDSAGGDQINTFIKIMKPAGRIVFYGATNGMPAKLDMFRMFWNQITLQGSTMGNDIEFVKMIKFVDDKKLVPIVDSVRPFGEIVDAFDQMKVGNRVGKLVATFNNILL